MTIKSRTHTIAAVLSFIAISLLPGCSRAPGKPLDQSPVAVTKLDYTKQSNTLEGTITNRTTKPLASVTVLLHVYVGGDAMYRRRVTVDQLKASEKRDFSSEDTSGVLKKPSTEVSKIVVAEIETSEPARYEAS